jgi:hypothetical protein
VTQQTGEGLVQAVCLSVARTTSCVHSGKRARSSKIYEDGPGGVLTYAVCNHCCKVLKGDSAMGTSHLIRHPCYKTQTRRGLEGPNNLRGFEPLAVAIVD